MKKPKIKKAIVYKTLYSSDTANKLRSEINLYFKDNKKSQNLLIEFPTVYIINNQISKKKNIIYVGETTDIQRRTIEHLVESREDFQELNESSNVKMYVIGHEHFNKSLTLDIENRLMQYLSSVNSVKKLNNRRHNEQNKYYDSEEFNSIFYNVWQQLNEEDESLFPSRKKIESSAIFKASPFNKLTDEQLIVKNIIIEKIDDALFNYKKEKNPQSQLILVKGNVGAGKTVLISNIFYDLANESTLNRKINNKLKIAFMVNHKEQLTLYRQIVKKLQVGNEKVVLNPSTFIKNYDCNNKVDIAFVDEAHLLLTQNSQSFAKKYGKKMLNSILERARVVVAVFDPLQMLTTSEVWEPRELENLENRAGNENIVTLHNQMRIHASDETINWLRNIIDNEIINKLPEDPTYSIKVFDTPLEMQRKIEEKNLFHSNGISRMVATFDWKYSGGNEKPPEEERYWNVSEGSWKMPWNYELKNRDKFEDKHKSLAYKDLAWVEKDYTINEIGSTYTVQGFDLNYVGVEIGPSVKYINGKIVHDPKGSMNSKAIQKRNSKESYAVELLKNEFNILLTRGVHGLYLHAVDSNLQQALKKAIQE